VTNISIATSDQWKDKTTGEKVERTEFHRVVFFNRLAEVAGDYLKKGAQVYVEGALRTRKWQDQSGQDRYTTEVVGSEMQMLGRRNGGSSSSGQDQYPESNQQRNSGHAKSSSSQPRRGNTTTQAPQNFDDFDDDIPF